MIEIREVVIPYRPRPIFVPFHGRTKRWAVEVDHRRAGKTVAFVNDLVKAALVLPLQNPRFAYIAPTFSQAKDIAWEYLKHYGLKVPGAEEHETELRVDFPNGGRVRLYGSDNYDRMRGIYLDGAIFDEYGDQDPRAFTEVVRPALSDRKGWAVFGGTPKGDNHFKEMRDLAEKNPGEWLLRINRASQTGIIDEQELASARRMMTAEQYAAEYECSFEGAVVGSYYGEELRNLELAKRIGDFAWLPDHAVYTFWDTGNTTAVWFIQIVGTDIRVIDYLEGVNKSAAFYVQQLRSKPYTYGGHVGPSDADDPKEITGKSWKTSFEELGLFGWQILDKQGSIDDGINQVQLLLPRCQFNTRGENNAEAGLTGLKNYRREWDEGRKTFRRTPRHDWASHPADGFRHLAVGLSLIHESQAKAGGTSDWSKPIKYKVSHAT